MHTLQKNFKVKNMEIKDLKRTLSSNEYPGRGIIIGRSKDSNYAIAAYWIMGRSENSRNRIFVQEGENLKTQAFEPSKLVDPSLIIYSPVKVYENHTIITNGDQTDTVYDGLKNGISFADSLKSRKFEPDSPNFTPRISADLLIENKIYSFKLSILKSDNGNENSCNRFTFDYENPQAGIGRFIHTYQGNGNPLPSFEGEPEVLNLNGNIDELSSDIWNSLNESNKVSLFVRFIDINTGKSETRIFNKNVK